MMSDTKTAATESSKTKNHPIRKRVLSIQSHVVSGYVGNKSAVFPMQLLGWEVDVVNSVQLSNHTGYPAGCPGTVLKGGELQQLLQGLRDNGLLSQVSHLLTGYIGSESFLSAVLDVWQALLEANNNTNHDSHHDNTNTNSRNNDNTNPQSRCCYVCDPVLGDHGRFYVPPSHVALYREKVLPQATIVTPNQFELEQLTRTTTTTTDGDDDDSSKNHAIRTLTEALQACRVLHDLGPTTVYVTSLQGLDDQANDEMTVLVSHLEDHQTVPLQKQQSTQQQRRRRRRVWKLTCPRLPGRFTGTGDLVAALVLVYSADHAPPAVLEKVVNTVFTILEDMHHNHNDKDNEGPASRELPLIAHKRTIENPPARFRAQEVVEHANE